MSWGSNKIAGIGPKQARHILKQIGLGRETMVLDSRLMNYLWSRGEPSTSLPWVAVLGDRPGFEMVEGWFIELARLAGITPVELDTLLWEAGGESLEDEDPPQE
jgi:thermostable 8-oxoguanine DNA glycosylase